MRAAFARNINRAFLITYYAFSTIFKNSIDFIKKVFIHFIIINANNVKKDMDMIDMVMYANHIFNPFSIKEGDIITVPADNDNLYKSSDEPSLPDGSKHSKNSKGEKTKTYAETVEYLAKLKKGWI